MEVSNMLYVRSQQYMHISFRKVALAFCVLMLSACATRIEYVPVHPPEPPRIERPVMETPLLKDEATPGDVIEAMRLDILRLQKWGLELEALLDGYRKKEPTK